MRQVLQAAGLLLLSACGPAQPGASTQSAPTPSPSFKPIDGFGEIKLGISFEEAMAKADPDLFNPYGLKECFSDLPIRGCSLHGDEGKVFVMRESIPYGLDLSFNRLGKLTDIGIDYDREGAITGAQCRDIFGRTLDWVAAEYGPLVDQQATDGNVTGKSPGGIVYAYLQPNKEGNFVGQIVRPRSHREENRPINGKNNFVSLNRSLYVLMTYIVVSKPKCSIHVSIHEPSSVERYVYDSTSN